MLDGGPTAFDEMSNDCERDTETALEVERKFNELGGNVAVAEHAYRR